METRAPKVVIIGRTNVGKSSLFNRLVEEQKSLVSDIPGTTRDRYEADCIWQGRVIRLIDTGGLDVDHQDEIEHNIAKQAEIAIQEADLLLFVADVKTGPLQEDYELAKLLQKVDAPVIMVANKADNDNYRKQVQNKEWYSFPFELPLAVSAVRGTGTGDLLDEVYKKLEAIDAPPVDIQDFVSTRVAVIGRPNVGKSTLLNALLGEQRFIAADKDHTTREPNDTDIVVDGQRYTLIDTAGMRRKAKIRAGKEKLESTGVERTERVMRRADVILYVIDVNKNIEMQDKYLAGQLADQQASVVIVANKWDLVPGKETNTVNAYEEYLRAMLPMLDYAPILFASAKTGKRVQNLFDMIDQVYKARFTQLSGSQTSKFIRQSIVRHKPSRGKGVAHPRITHFEQIGINPPIFGLNIKQTRKDALASSYLRFLENRLRERYDFTGTPIRIKVIAKKKHHTT